MDYDPKLLDSFERLFKVIDQEVNNFKKVKLVYIEMIRQWEKEIRSYARMIEDISLPSRLILEHILELKQNSGQMAVEAENINQGFASINNVEVEEFGVIKISTGSIKLLWRDADYNYLLYPDKAELRTLDEKTVIRLFFSHNFGQQHIQRFAGILTSPKLLYIHPDLKKFMEQKQV
ncbi:MAG: hypothetical protein GX091_02215 [Peptococcaceae bacterium]|nr:hypothetical protein [Peptococcaceae bacterium]